MIDLRELLLVETWGAYSQMRDNDEGFPGAQGAYVISEDGETVLHIKSRRVVIPATEMHDRGASEAVDQLLWTAAYTQDAIPGVSPGGLLDGLNKQVSSPVQKLYAKPGTPAWARAEAERGDLPLIEALGKWPSGWLLGPNVVLGLPHPEDLGVSLQTSGGVQGLCVFPRFVAAAWCVS